MLASSFLSALALAGPPGSIGAGAPTKYAIEQLTVPPQLAKLGIQRARTVNGPFAVPGMVANDTSDDNGMGTFQELASLPCFDCYITGFSFGIHYVDANGSVSAGEANVNTGIYLHHAVLINMNRTDATCPLTSGGSFQRMFGAGNERGYADLSLNGTKRAGYYVGKEDIIALVAEIMNMQMGPARKVVVTSTWDYVTAEVTNTQPEGMFAAAVPVWLDIDGNCGSYTNGSEVAVPANATVFSYSMPAPWSPDAGKDGALRKYNVLLSASHLHDGGLQLDISKNGTIVCEGVANYGETPAYISEVPGEDMPGMPGMSMGSTELTHISSIHMCSGVGATSSDDHWSVTAHYNLTAHPGLETINGNAKPIMGIGIMFLVETY
ncbi:hypothetical protein SEUCBS139899_004160 [Sporothrix eucalyptigena]|uniref:Uncharacterized protein n=1 Tax=Sporothrix eucalyptigena TaxID=1812306 RepID=A0ABP0B0Y6_9PEZI